MWRGAPDMYCVLALVVGGGSPPARNAVDEFIGYEEGGVIADLGEAYYVR